MARVAMIVSNPCTGDARVIKMARAALDAGHEVHVFATARAGVSPYEEVDGVRYHRIEWRPGQMIAGKGLVKLVRAVSRKAGMGLARRITPYRKYRLFSRVFADSVASIKPDIIHAHDLICLQAACDAADECGARVVYDAHELETHRNPPLPFLQKRWVTRVERKYSRKAAEVITVGRYVGDVLSHTIRRRNINILYNSPQMAPCARTIRQDLNMDDSVPLLLYVGKVTMGRGVAEILTALPQAAGVHFITVGPCDDNTRMELLNEAERLGVAERFRILPPVPFNQVVSYIRGADLGIISVEPVTLSYRYCMPNKLFELAFANVPIISNKLDEIEEFIGEHGNGEIVELTEDPALPYKIFRMIREKNRYVMSEETMQKLHDKYSWTEQAAKLAAIYERVLGNAVTAGRQ